MKKLLPILLAVIGIAGGVGAGLMLRPEPTTDLAEAECISLEDVAELRAQMPPAEDEQSEFVKMNNQFVVPVVEEDRVASMVVLSLSVEVPVGSSELIYAREPKLRDAYLQVLFDHANLGGFSGAFTEARVLNVLRRSLTEASFHVVGDVVSDVLITEIARQDM